MKLIIAGSRHFDDKERVLAAIDSKGLRPQVTEVVCGASEEDVRRARQGKRRLNVDIIGALWAEANGIPVKHFPANWKAYGDPAGPIRNSEMADYADALLLVWDGVSKGSKDMKEKAERRNLPFYQAKLKWFN